MRYQFVDCRWALDDPALGQAQYLAGHIPGASFLDVAHDLSDLTRTGEGRHPLPTAEQFAEAASRAGIGEGVFVVAYGSMAGAERLWWLLRHFGHDACGVIDLAAWRGPLAEGEEPITAATFVPAERDDDVIARDALAQTLDRHVIVDARLPPRYRGEPNPVDAYPGRIPGALNAPWNEPLPDLPSRRPRRLLRIRHHRMRRPPQAAPRGARQPSLPRLVVRLGADRPPARLRLGRERNGFGRL
ncbi:unannotated protein [freshwater metagenome]|uniref:Unannotated protein n=1 Tax=freshwater metagenome TaxID=449393 RepID=A0A6J6NDA8_9ZZZZ